MTLLVCSGELLAPSGYVESAHTVANGFFQLEEGG